MRLSIPVRSSTNGPLGRNANNSTVVPSGECIVEEGACTELSRYDESAIASLGPAWGIALLGIGLFDMVALPFTPFGFPLILAGVLVLAPHSRTIDGIDRWMHGRFPKFRGRALRMTHHSIHWSGNFQTRFRDDLQKRYPDDAG